MSNDVKLTKGERTAQRILDAAENLFAEKGYDGTSLREVADIVGIREPGLYRHFANKQELYRCVLERGLRPLANFLDQLISEKPTPKDLNQVPGTVIDLLAEHPNMPALFQQSLLSHNDKLADGMMDEWLDLLLERGKQVISMMGFGELDDTEVALRLVNMFNLCAGYFASSSLVAKLSGRKTPLDKKTLLRQKELVNSVMRTWMLS